jgi:hypothetical protein
MADRKTAVLALLENSTEYADFLEFIRSYARTRSSSRTTTELCS